MDKSESMCHQACIPDSWWEFAFAHATHIYNCTPVAHLKWRTPHEMLKGEMPIIDHLHVFGCGAFVYLPATARANKMAPKSELIVKTGSSRSGTDERGKCDNVGLSAACPSNEATIRSVVVAVA